MTQHQTEVHELQCLLRNSQGRLQMQIQTIIDQVEYKNYTFLHRQVCMLIYMIIAILYNYIGYKGKKEISRVFLNLRTKS